MAASPASFLIWLRKFHAWVGLSGAAFGLLFGITGFLQNHRAVMKIEAGRIEERKVTVDLGEAPATVEALAQALYARARAALLSRCGFRRSRRTSRHPEASPKVSRSITRTSTGSVSVCPR